MNELRLDPATNEWVVFATDRSERDGDQSDCPFCPVPRGSGEIPVDAFSIAVLENAYPPLRSDPDRHAQRDGRDLYAAAPAIGRAEVIVYSDRHDAALTTIDTHQMRHLVDVWADRYRVLSADPRLAYVLIFENAGEVMGATVDHPHQQIYGCPDVPPRPAREIATSIEYLAEHGTCVWCDVVARERADRRRIVAENRNFIASVPFAARFPFEVQILTHRHATNLLTLTAPERDALAEILVSVMRCYAALLGADVAYAMAVHQRPTNDDPVDPVCHLRLDFMPPHTEPGAISYLGGSQLGGGVFVNEVAPEDAAVRLREAGGMSTV